MPLMVTTNNPPRHRSFFGPLLLVGVSSGANVAAAVAVARRLGPGKRVVTILCDSGERYFSMDAFVRD